MDNQACLSWWQMQIEIVLLSFSYFEDTLNLKVDYRALKKACDGDITMKNHSSISFSCMADQDTSLENYLSAIKTNVPGMQDKSDDECLEWWKKQIGESKIGTSFGYVIPTEKKKKY